MLSRTPKNPLPNLSTHFDFFHNISSCSERVVTITLNNFIEIFTNLNIVSLKLNYSNPVILIGREEEDNFI